MVTTTKAAPRVLPALALPRPVLWGAVGLLLLALSGLGAWWVFGPTAITGRSELTVTARDLRFNGNNAPVIVPRGHEVRITVKNEEPPGITHNFVVSSLGVKSRVLQPGESESLDFVAGKVGSYKYVCTLHPGQMAGYFRISDQ